MNEKAVSAMKDFLEAIGIDLAASRMENTPERVASMYEYLFNGVGMDTGDLWGELFHAEADGMVVIKDIPFYSMCEHHLVPFFGKVSIAYQPHDGMVAGFSKFTKLVERISHRPQLQERMTQQIADAITEGIGADGVLVIVDAQQLCMTMRGAVAHDSRTITSACTGCLNNDGMKKQAWIMLGMRDEEK